MEVGYLGSGGGGVAVVVVMNSGLLLLRCGYGSGGAAGCCW